jgi:hypothetical protein
MARVFIGGLPYALSTAELWDFLGDFGGLQSAMIVQDRETGRSRGFGFAEFASSRIEVTIAQLNGRKLGNRTITVRLARPIGGSEPSQDAHAIEFFSQQERAIEEFEDASKQVEIPDPPRAIVELGCNIPRLLIERMKVNPSEMYRITPREFEQVMAELFEADGAIVELTQFSKDGGYDILVQHVGPLGLKSVWAVQCKRYKLTRKIGAPIINGLMGIPIVREGNAKPILATTSTFTRNAIQAAARIHNVGLIDHEDISKLVQSYSLQGLESITHPQRVTLTNSN